MKRSAYDSMREKLNLREALSSIRNLQQENTLYDFSSNDYLGFARSQELKNLIKLELEKYPQHLSGATGSRLLSGNSAFAEFLEKEIAAHHQAAHGLLFNTGYAANTALFSSLPQKGDTVIYDEYIHASVIDGTRLSFATRLKFRHNDLEDLEKKLLQCTGTCYVAVESVYSMDGDLADLTGISALCTQYEAHLIVDEAHAFGVLGTGLVDLLKIQTTVFARVITFGKALGLHGAIVLGSDLLRDYLINFARPFIYSTASPFSLLISLQVAYKHLLSHPEHQVTLQHKSSLLKAHLPPREQLRSSCNPAAIQAIFLNGNEETVRLSKALQQRGFDVRPIRSPTVPKGKERLRICLHIHNTDQEILELCHHLKQLSQ